MARRSRQDREKKLVRKLVESALRADPLVRTHLAKDARPFREAAAR